MEVLRFSELIDEQVKAEISGKNEVIGILVDEGLDVIVLYNGYKYIYIPLLHLHSLEKYDDENPIKYDHKTIKPMFIEEDSISYRKILINAKGMFVETYVTGNKALHGYITSVLTDYFVFYSPVFKYVLVSFHHLKWLIPYPNTTTPYSLNEHELPVVPAMITVNRTFEEQLKKFINKLVVFDLGEKQEKIGVLKSVQQNFVELVTAEGHTVFLKISHIKTVHVP
ncbi:DUF2642 domain-containing protein [Bacillaceae bacterium ZC4]|nr:DUF2642 domain-containing protein [Bacillaceae bacterium ZC4]